MSITELYLICALVGISTIDKLWVKRSGGMFGFSVQKAIVELASVLVKHTLSTISNVAASVLLGFAPLHPTYLGLIENINIGKLLSRRGGFTNY
ncbi:MAG: hypothetical protein F6K47_26520 [Symploca sp. SIO2E6]|nr:hypothetical protein [Symploca sp. SIO2E6]